MISAISQYNISANKNGNLALLAPTPLFPGANTNGNLALLAPTPLFPGANTNGNQSRWRSLKLELKKSTSG